MKSWTFRIAANLGRDLLRQRQRWPADAQDRSKALAMGSPKIAEAFMQVHQHSPSGRYEIREHIDTCFTCIGKTLPLRQQVVLLLKDVYGFSVSEIMEVVDLTEGATKYALQTARKTLTQVFAKRCALVNKNGICHQCTELNGWFNPAQRAQAAAAQLELVQQAEHATQAHLLSVRTALVRAIDPLQHPGHALQDALLECNRMAMGEME